MADAKAAKADKAAADKAAEDPGSAMGPGVFSANALGKTEENAAVAAAVEASVAEQSDTLHGGVPEGFQRSITDPAVAVSLTDDRRLALVGDSWEDAPSPMHEAKLAAEKARADDKPEPVNEGPTTGEFAGIADRG